MLLPQMRWQCLLQGRCQSFLQAAAAAAQTVCGCCGCSTHGLLMPLLLPLQLLHVLLWPFVQVRAYTDHGHTLYVMDEQGQPPDPRKVQSACQAGGGLQQGPAEGLPMGVSPPNMGGIIGSNSGAATVAAAAAAAAAAAGSKAGEGALLTPGAKFFYMLQKRGGWDGSPNSLTSM